jgi:hypothetical protein
VKIRYVGPFDSVEIEVAGRFVDVARDAVVDLPVAVAGRAPSQRLIEILDVELPAVAADHEQRHAVLAELASLDAADYGEGLLAQHTIWQAVKAADKKESDQ